MNLNLEKSNNFAVSSFTKLTSINAENYYVFKQQIKEFLAQSDYKIIINCENLEFLDSSGVSALISCYKDAVTNDGWIRIAALIEPVNHIFNLIKLDKIFEIYKTVETAKTASICNE